jgi:replicative DNA helicase
MVEVAIDVKKHRKGGTGIAEFIFNKPIMNFVCKDNNYDEKK